MWIDGSSSTLRQLQNSTLVTHSHKVGEIWINTGHWWLQYNVSLPLLSTFDANIMSNWKRLTVFGQIGVNGEENVTDSRDDEFLYVFEQDILEQLDILYRYQQKSWLGVVNECPTNPLREKQIQGNRLKGLVKPTKIDMHRRILYEFAFPAEMTTDSLLRVQVMNYDSNFIAMLSPVHLSTVRYLTKLEFNCNRLLLLHTLAFVFRFVLFYLKRCFLMGMSIMNLLSSSCRC